MRSYLFPFAALVVVGCAFGSPDAPAQDQAVPGIKPTGADRKVLPLPAPEFKDKVGENYKDTTPDRA